MKTVDISLSSIDKVKTFVNLINRFDYDFIEANINRLNFKEIKYVQDCEKG